MDTMMQYVLSKGKELDVYCHEYLKMRDGSVCHRFGLQRSVIHNNDHHIIW